MFFMRFILSVSILFSFIFSDTIYEKETKHLFNYLSNSECIFERNGKFYKADKVKKHIINKRDYFKDNIKSTEDFIKYSATKSEISKKKYKVYCKNKKVQELGVWLLKELKIYRQNR